MTRPTRAVPIVSTSRTSKRGVQLGPPTSLASTSRDMIFGTAALARVYPPHWEDEQMASTTIHDGQGGFGQFQPALAFAKPLLAITRC